jgi:hypothetical protein
MLGNISIYHHESTPAIALTKWVFPVPGGPKKMMVFGGMTPCFIERSRSVKGSMIRLWTKCFGGCESEIVSHISLPILQAVGVEVFCIPYPASLTPTEYTHQDLPCFHISNTVFHKTFDIIVVNLVGLITSRRLQSSAPLNDVE